MPVAFPEPTDPRISRAEVFVSYIDFFRERAIAKVEGLAGDEARRRRLPSRWSALELLHHLRHVERRWLEWGFEGVDVDDPWADEEDGRWRVPAETTVADVVRSLRAQGDRSRTVVGAHELTDVGQPGPRWDGAAPPPLERVLFHLVQEYARHLGQLDVVVELAGGSTGE